VAAKGSELKISQGQIEGAVLSLVVALVVAFIVSVVKSQKRGGGVITRFKAWQAQRKEDKLHIRVNIPHLKPPPSERQCSNSTELYIVKRGKPKSLARCTLCTQEFYVIWKDKEWVLAK
jgi:hypothetical protein